MKLTSGKAYRPISFLAKYKDIEWLAKKTCPECDVTGRLMFGLHPREIIRCMNCGCRRRLKGRLIHARTN